MKGEWLTVLMDKNAALVGIGDPRALKGAEWPVLVAVCSRVNDGNLRDARVYREWIADHTGASLPTVDRALGRLRDNGWITRVSQGGTRKVDGNPVNMPSVYDIADGPNLLTVDHEDIVLA